MRITSCISEIINRYGSNLFIETRGRRVAAKAFLQPLRYRNKVYIGGEYHPLGFRKTEKYLYVGKPDIELLENVSVIEMRGSKYIVKRSEIYIVADIPVYVWAILLPFGERLEDDYESN